MDDIRDMRFSVRGRSGEWSAPSLVHADQWKISGCPVNGPALAVNGSQSLAAWTTMQGDALSVRTALGNTRGFGEMTELNHGSGLLGRVDVAPWRSHEFLISWVAQESMPVNNTLRSPKIEVTSIHLDVVDRHGKLGERAILAALKKGSNPGMPRLATSGQSAIAVWTESAAGHTSIKAALIQE
jgi:hypothetical protein